MKNRIARLLGPALVVTAVMAAAIPAVAHHSFAMFNQRQVMTLKGTVRQFQWTNPHSFIALDVPSSAASKRWNIELNSPNNLRRQGWTRRSIAAGDKVTIRISPLRDGRRGGLFLDLTFANGIVLDSGLPKNGTPVNVPQI